MPAFPALLSFLRCASCWLAALAALAVAGLSTAAVLMFFWVLPNIDDHRETVAKIMSRALGQQVTLEAVSGVWQQARPEFRLQGVRLYDSQGRPALYLPEFEATFSWRSLLFLEPRFGRIELHGLALGVRRARDGHFYVGGIPVNPGDPDGKFSDWLLRQGRVHVGNATLTWLDELRGAPPLNLQAVDFTLVNSRRNHRMQLSATPPGSLARPLAIDAQLRARRVSDTKTWSGTVEARLTDVSFPELAAWLQVPYQPRRGQGALHVRFDVAGGALTGATAGLDLRNIETLLGEGLPPLRLERVQGQALWRSGPDGQRVAFEKLRVALPGGSLEAPFNAGLKWNADSREITAEAFQLSGWQSLLPSLPMDEALRARLQTLQPQGRLETLRFRWTGAQPGLENFSVTSRFSGLGMKAVGNQPGLANLTGRIEGDAGAGRFEIDSRQMELDLPGLFREPRIPIDTLSARGNWKKTGRGRLISLEEASFANRDATGSASGSYELLAGHPGIIDLSAQLSRADGLAVYRYLPKSIGDQTVDWVRRAVIAGGSDDVQLVLRGDLKRFPFDQGGGEFSVDVQVRDGVIDYVQDWPRIEGIRARMLFAGKSMIVTSTQARIYGVALSPVKAEIPDLLHHEEMLQIVGEANGPVQDFIRFANFSPVGKRLRGFTDALEGSGPMRLALKLQVPLRHSHDATLAGKLSFLGNTLLPPGLPRIDQVRGDIGFTHDSIRARDIGAQFLGGPLKVEVAHPQDRVQILAEGRATAAGLAPWLGEAGHTRLSGQSRWRGRIDLEPVGERIRIESDLIGLGSTLPAPLAKAAAQPLPLLVTRQPQTGGELHEVQLGSIVSAVWRNTAAGGFSRGEIRFGGQAAMPAEPGLRLAGSGRGMDITGWAALLPKGEGGHSLPLASIDLGFDAFDLMGRRYQDVRLQGRNRNGLLRIQATGRELDGVLTYRPAGAVDSSGASARGGSESPGTQPARVSAQFRQFTIPPPLPAIGEAGEGVNMKAADFPILDVVVDDFRLQKRSLGRLELVASGAARGLVIDSLQITHPDSVFRMSGLWRDDGLSETRTDLSLTVLDAGKFLARFGYPDALKRGSAEIKGNAAWAGSPADFAFDSLAGQLEFKAKSGQFLKVDPGAGKLLGVLSLQSLPRRLNFDFRDIFNEGYAFDDIGATLRIARGVIYSDDFRMRGPAAKVNMSGMADLNQESVQLRVKVIPKLSEGVAVAGALIGGPLAGVGALAAQKMLRDPIEEATSQEYMVTGPWMEPDVKKLTKPQAKTETQTSEP